MKFKITLLAVLMVTAKIGGLEAATVLPTMKVADDFGGTEVTNLDKFVPSVADYTLEVDATAGTAITIGFGQLAYTPVASGTVRFVQQGKQVYVFENNAYTTQLTPVYDYTETGDNLLRNPSFETVGEQFSAGRWRATDWETWNGGTQTWGGEVGYVNVRENASYRSDGLKSIILHSESRWLGQQLSLGVLEPEKVYMLSYDFWTSDGSDNGDAVYRVQIGVGLANNNVMDMEGHSTINNSTAQQSFACAFQMPQALPDDLYLSLYRAVAKVDWLDNMRLIQILPAAQGITGVTHAVYTTGAFAPMSMTLPEGTYIDMTKRLKNSDFDDSKMTGNAPTGWTLDAQVTQSKISTASKGDGFIAANQNHWQLWQDNGALTGKACQTVTNLPGGKYRVSCAVSSTGFGGSVQLYANYGKTSIAPNASKNYEVTGIVVDGTLEMGLQLATTGGVTLDFDRFTLHYLGMDIDGYREVLAIKLSEAKDIVANHEDGYDLANLNAAVDAAEALAAESSVAEITQAVAAIDAALGDYRVYLADREAERLRIAKYEALIVAARQELEADDYPGREEFVQAIAVAEAADRSGELDKAADALNAAREIYYNSQFAIAPVQQTVSSVDLSLNGSEKFVLRIDGKPFYATEIQLRPDKLRGYEGWSEQEMEAVFKRAADDGFSTVSVPLFWSEVELQKNHFDWRILDRYMGWCKKYGMKMELLWFSWSSGGRIQYLWNYGGKKVLRTPDYVCAMDGTSEYNMLRKEWEYSLDWRDVALRDRETYVLGRIMEHVALWDANNGQTHTVVGVQLGNEASTHGNNTASDAEIINWYHHVGSAVKQSKYVTWTRLNCVSWMTSGRTNANENLRNNGGTNIDFVGIDIYGTNASKVKGNMDGQLGNNGKNYRMIMEIDAKDSNSPFYQMAALAGDKAFDYYNMGPVDGNGLYGSDGHRLTERSHIGLVRQRNKILNLANQDIALKKNGVGLYVYNYSAGSTFAETGIATLTFTPDAATTQAIALRHSSYELLLLSTAKGTFSWPSSLGVVKAERGYMNEDNEWVSEGEVMVNNNRLTMPATSCVRLLLEGAPMGQLVNPSFDNDYMGWTVNYDGTANPKISTVAKPQDSSSPLIAGGQPHLQVWGINATGQIVQTIENLPDGKYEIGATVCSVGNVSLTLFAGDDETAITSDGRHTVSTTVAGGRLRLGLGFVGKADAIIDVDDFTLTESHTTGVDMMFQDQGTTVDDGVCFDLSGRRIVNPTRGIYIKNGKKFIVK